MLIRLCFLFFIFLVNSLCCTAVNGEDKSAQGQPQLFTNQDIEKYKGPSDAKATDTTTVLREDREEVRNNKNKSIREDQEKEYWCKKA